MQNAVFEIQLKTIGPKHSWLKGQIAFPDLTNKEPSTMYSFVNLQFSSDLWNFILTKDKRTLTTESIMSNARPASFVVSPYSLRWDFRNVAISSRNSLMGA